MKIKAANKNYGLQNWRLEFQRCKKKNGKKKLNWQIINCARCDRRMFINSISIEHNAKFSQQFLARLSKSTFFAVKNAVYDIASSSTVQSHNLFHNFFFTKLLRVKWIWSLGLSLKIAQILVLRKNSLDDLIYPNEYCRLVHTRCINCWLLELTDAKPNQCRVFIVNRFTA